MTRKALGRGLSALLREVETASAGLAQVHVDLIEPNPYQPRRTFTEESLAELAASIRSSGLVQPVLLRRVDERYQLVAGERRWRAARLAGLESIPAVVRELTDRDALELALTENLLREDLNPLDVAHAFGALQDKYGLSHEEIADRLGLSRTGVTNTLRLLRLPQAVQSLLASGDISAGHARALVALDSATLQTQLAKVIAKRGLSVRQVEAMVALQELKSKAKTGQPPPKIDPNIRAAVLELERTLGTRVRLIGNGQRGKIEISYFSPEELNRIYEAIVRS